MQKNRKQVLLEAKQNREVTDVEVRGDSMLPLVPSGSILYMQFCNIKDVRNGDIIAFYDSHHHIIVHRCIITKNNRVMERGDNCILWYPCGWVFEEQLLGKIIQICNGEHIISTEYGYRAYSFMLTLLGRVSNRIGIMRKRDGVNERHQSISEGQSFDKLICGLTCVCHKLLIKAYPVDRGNMEENQ